MLGHGAGIRYTGPGPRMGPIDNFSLVTGSLLIIGSVDISVTVCFCVCLYGYGFLRRG